VRNGDAVPTGIYVKVKPQWFRNVMGRRASLVDAVWAQPVLRQQKAIAWVKMWTE